MAETAVFPNDDPDDAEDFIPLVGSPYSGTGEISPIGDMDLKFRTIVTDIVVTGRGDVRTASKKVRIRPTTVLGDMESEIEADENGGA